MVVRLGCAREAFLGPPAQGAQIGDELHARAGVDPIFDPESAVACRPGVRGGDADEDLGRTGPVAVVADARDDHVRGVVGALKAALELDLTIGAAHMQLRGRRVPEEREVRTRQTVDGLVVQQVYALTEGRLAMHEVHAAIQVEGRFLALLAHAVRGRRRDGVLGLLLKEILQRVLAGADVDLWVHNRTAKYHQVISRAVADDAYI